MWYHIKARDMGIFKPNGKVITFWLWGDSEDHIRDLLSKKNCIIFILRTIIMFHLY